MSVQPLAHPRLSGDQRLVGAGPTRRRTVPSPRRIARRRTAVLLTKWFLPVAALALLSSIAIWPELGRVTEEGRVSFRRVFGAVADGAEVIQPHYRGIDARGRPYTMTADTATQAGPERVNLVTPKGDVTLESGHWLMVQSKAGVFYQHRDLLDLSGDVQLYRDDGVTLSTQTASMDLRQGAGTSNDQTHAEGPFGQLDAQGFTLVDKGAIIQFHGPSRLILNQSHP
jgi:lipopolysaccharide export system protein LptC